MVILSAGSMPPAQFAQVGSDDRPSIRFSVISSKMIFPAMKLDFLR